MKCPNCGEELSDGVLFCRECGCKIPQKPKKRFCRECGHELESNAKFCSACGAKVLTQENVARPLIMEGEPSEENTADVSPKENGTQPKMITGSEESGIRKGRLVETVKEKCWDLWNSFDTYERVCVITGLLFLICFLTAWIADKPLAVMASFIQLGAAIISYLIHRGVIKTKERWPNYVLPILAAILCFSYVSGLGAGKSKATKSTSVAEAVVTTSPESSQIAVPFGSDACVGVSLTDLKSALQTAGFTNISMEEIKPHELAFVEKEHNVANISIAGKEVFDKGQEFPTNAEIKIRYYSAQPKKNAVELVINFPGNWIFNTYDVTFKLDDVDLGYLEHGKNADIKLNLDAGDHVLTAISKENVAVKGSVPISVTEDACITVTISCNTDEIDISQTEYESRRELDENEIRVLKSSEAYKGSDYQEVVAELERTGFANVTTECIRDITGGWGSAKENSVKAVMIDGREDFGRSEIFQKDAPIVVIYHIAAYTQDEIRAKIAECMGKPAENIISFFDDTNCNVSCYVLGKQVDPFNPEGYQLESADVSQNAKDVILNFTTPEIIEMRETLEKQFPKEMAQRVVITSMTNAQADDIYKSDGVTCDPNKFHKFDDISGFYLSAYDYGMWNMVDEKTWHVDSMECLMSGSTMGLRVSCDVSIDGDYYVLSDVEKSTMPKDEMKQGKSDARVFRYDNYENFPMLKVASGLVKNGRDPQKEKDRNNRTMPTDEREEWEDKQFLGSQHMSLAGLIKKNLNDEKSYSHIKTEHVSILTEDAKKTVNDLLQKNGYKQRVEVGDIFIMCEFSAKNAFNATIKKTALGYVSYTTDMVYLIGFE